MLETDEMRAQEADEIIVVGAGPVGATMALLCASKGLRVRLVERKREPMRHPAAHVLNGRSLEIWEEISQSIPCDIVASSLPLDRLREITWQTALVGETVGSVAMFDDDEMLARARSHGRWRTAHCGQHKLEPLLWQAVRAEPLIEFQVGARCVGVEEREDSIEAVVEVGGRRESYRAAYVVCAEGASSSLRDTVGIAMIGERIADVASVFFRARLPADVERDTPILVWIVNGEIVGPVIRHDDGDWVLMTFYPRSVMSPDDFTDEWWLPRIRAALGERPGPASGVEIRSRGTWTMTSEIAEAYRAGRVFLVGDAAHRFPPTGGYGLNAGVADAHNLAWKLACVLRHDAGDALLDTYERERKPVARQLAAQSVHNHAKMDLVNRHLGIRTGALVALDRALSSVPLRWIPRSVRRAFAERVMAAGLRGVGRKLDPASPRRDELLRAIGVDIEKQKEHFSGIGLEFGYAYAAGFVLPETGEKPVDGDGIHRYRPTTWPGARLPYAPLDGTEAAASSHDLVSRQHMTLLVAPGDERVWSQRVAERGPDERSLELEVRTLDLRDPERWSHEMEVGPGGAILVRPDGHVAWRCKSEADAVGWDDAIAALSRVYTAGATRGALR